MPSIGGQFHSENGLAHTRKAREPARNTVPDQGLLDIFRLSDRFP
jgi:hypothetical protein